MARIGMGVAAAVALATLASTPANAATYIYDLTAPTSTSGTGNGNSMTYVQGSGANQLSFRATGWSIDTNQNPDLVQNGILKSYSGSGLGVVNRGETGTSPNHSIDNSAGWIDFVMLQFDRKVDLNSINIGWYSTDADATIMWGSTGTAWNNASALTTALHNKPYSTLDAMTVGEENSDVTSNFLGWRGVNTTNVMADTWIIAARNTAANGNDYFKLRAISVDAAAAVPEPATWMAMLVGFGAIGVAQRRRRPAADGKKALAPA